MKTIPDNESLFIHIKQSGVTFGPKKLEVFKRALALRGTPALYANEEIEDPLVRVKLFDPCGSWTWYITEWDGENEAFGLVSGFEEELGYIDLKELSDVAGPLRIGIEVDEYFKPCPLSQIKKP